MLKALSTGSCHTKVCAPLAHNLPATRKINSTEGFQYQKLQRSHHKFKGECHPKWTLHCRGIVFIVVAQPASRHACSNFQAAWFSVKRSMGPCTSGPDGTEGQAVTNTESLLPGPEQRDLASKSLFAPWHKSRAEFSSRPLTNWTTFHQPRNHVAPAAWGSHMSLCQQHSCSPLDLEFSEQL